MTSSQTLASAVAFFCFTCFVCTSIATVVGSNIQWLSYAQKWNQVGGGPYENETFNQRLAVDKTYWDGATKNASIIVYFGGEESIEGPVDRVGIVKEAAVRFGSLIVYIEHRLYGTSIPYGPIDKALRNPIVRSYLSTQQALADFAEVIVSLKTNLSAHNSPTIVVGSSYSGVLAVWFRLRYPNISIGALASSAPVLFYQDLPTNNDFCAVVTRDFEHVNGKCADIIRRSFIMIDEVASQSGGLPFLSQKFNMCMELSSSYQLKVILAGLYSSAAQYNGRFNSWINLVCDPIMKAANEDPINRIARTVSVNMAEETCLSTNMMRFGVPFAPLDQPSQMAWNWQVCTELAINKGCKGQNMLLPQDIFYSRAQFMEDCRVDYMMGPDPNKGRPLYDIKDIQAGSNIIFSNGLMDPFSSAGIVKDLSHTVVAITTKKGSHCLDVPLALKDDPKWLKIQRKKEIRVMKRWISHAPEARVSHSYLLLLLLSFLLFAQFL